MSYIINFYLKTLTSNASFKESLVISFVSPKISLTAVKNSMQGLHRKSESSCLPFKIWESIIARMFSPFSGLGFKTDASSELTQKMAPIAIITANFILFGCLQECLVGLYIKCSGGWQVSLYQF